MIGGAQRTRAADAFARGRETNVCGLLDQLRSDSGNVRASAWRALYDQNFDRVYRLLYRLGIPLADLEDATQEVFLTAHRRIEAGAAIRSVRPWLAGVAVRVASRAHRWARVRRLKQRAIEVVFAGWLGASPTPENDATARELEDQVRRVVAEMTPKLRDVLVLTDGNDMSVSEVAEVLGIPVNTVRSRRRRARQQFLRRWNQRMGEEST